MKPYLRAACTFGVRGVAVAAMLITALVNTPNALACNISANGCGGTGAALNNCGGDQWADGAWQTSNGSPGWPWVVSGTVTSYNPSPVWSQSSAWVMLTNNNYTGCNEGCFVQVGWNHWYSCSTLPSGSGPGGGGTCSSDGHEHVFVDWTNNSGGEQPIYYYNIPSGSTENFAVVKSSSGYFYMEWNEGTTQTPSSGVQAATWGPSGIEISEEVHDTDGGCCNHGSQWGGDSSTQVQFTNLKWQDQNANVYTPSMSPQGGVYAYMTVPNGGKITSWFDVRDLRC